MRLYLDSSALVKRYVLAPGTGDVVDLCRRCEEGGSSVVGGPEVISAVRRRLDEGALKRKAYGRLRSDLAADLEQATIVPVDHAVLRRSIEAIERGSLRALDAIHVASALVSACDLFVSADARQSRTARLMGLDVAEIAAGP